MDRVQHRRSKTTSSGIEGIPQSQKPKPVTRFSPEYRRSNIDGSTNDDNMFTIELGESSSSRRVTGRPMRMHLAEEMYKDAESRKRASATARFVGFEGLSSTRPRTQPHKLSDSSQKQSTLLNFRPNRQQTYDGWSNRRSSMGQQQELRDVYKEPETVNPRRSTRWSSVDSLLTDHEKSLIEGKLTKSVNPLSTHGKLPGSLNVDDTSGSYIELLKPRDFARYEGSSIAWKSKKYPSIRDRTSHVERQDGLLLERYNQYKARKSHQSPEIQVEKKKKKEVNIPEGKLVVLKPGNKKDSSRDWALSKMISKDARGVARDVVKQLLVESGQKSSKLKGYAGDESSYDAHDSDFDSEVEMLKLPARNSFGGYDNKWSRKNPSFNSVDWSKKDATNRFSERWVTTPRYQDLEIVNKTRTLREMLAVPDKEKRTGSLNGLQKDPLGISSKDGWKDGTNKTKSGGSISLPPPVGSQRQGTNQEALSKEKHVVQILPMRVGRVKIAIKSRSHNVVVSTQDSKSRSKKPLPCEHINSKEIESSSNTKIEIEVEVNVKDISQQMIGMAVKDNADESPVSGVTTLSPEDSHVAPNQPLPVVDDGKAAADDAKAAADCDQKDPIRQELQKIAEEASSLQNLLAEPDTSESLKEAAHASPVSGFQVPLTEDTSSSDSFDKTNVELHEFRMQLQLLKPEAGSYDDVSALAPIENEIAQLYSILNEENYISGAENWEVSYALDVLIESGLQECGFDTFIAKWYSPECPLDPKLFKNLEKNYTDANAELRPERRKIFHRINWALVEIFQQNVDPCPWVMPKLAGFSRQRELVIEDLGNLIDRVFTNEGIIRESGLDKVMMWSESGYKAEIIEIGNEVGELLLNDIIFELICNV